MNAENEVQHVKTNEKEVIQTYDVMQTKNSRATTTKLNYEPKKPEKNEQNQARDSANIKCELNK